MELDPTMHRELAVFFNKRFPAAAERRAMAAAARVHSPEPPEQRGEVAWGVLLTRAAEQGRLQRLVDNILERPEADDATREVCALMLGRPWPPRPSLWQLPLVRATAGLAAVAAVGLVAVAWSAGGRERGAATPVTEPSEVEPSADELAMAAADGPVRMAEALGGPSPEEALEAAILRTAVTSASAAVPAAPPPPPAAVAKVSAPVAPKPAAAAPPAMVPAAAAPAAAPPRAAAARATPRAEGETIARHHGRCTTEAGGLVGYWYAGPEKPGERGAVITMKSWANVRADLPGPHNHYNSRAPERCALKEGDRVRLSAEPVQIAGGVYWVPISSGDIVTEG